MQPTPHYIRRHLVTNMVRYEKAYSEDTSLAGRVPFSLDFRDAITHFLRDVLQRNGGDFHSAADELRCYIGLQNTLRLGLPKLERLRKSYEDGGSVAPEDILECQGTFDVVAHLNFAAGRVQMRGDGGWRFYLKSGVCEAVRREIERTGSFAWNDDDVAEGGMVEAVFPLFTSFKGLVVEAVDPVAELDIEAPYSLQTEESCGLITNVTLVTAPAAYPF